METIDKAELLSGDKKLLEGALKKSISEMTTDDVAVIRARRAYLTPVEREIFKEVLSEKVEASEEEAEEEIVPAPKKAVARKGVKK